MKKNKKIIFSIVLNFLLLFGLIFVIESTIGITTAFNKIYAKVTARSEDVFYSDRYLTKVAIFDEKKAPSKSIVMLGDSLTSLNEWSESYENVSIYNRGIFGDTTSGVINRLAQVVKNKPEKVFLLIGINDLASGLSVEELIKNQDNIITTIEKKSPETKIYIQSLLPVGEKLSTVSNESIIETNKKLKSYAKENSMIYIDLHSLFIDNGGNLNSELTVDDLHINGKGYKMWEDEISKYIYD